MPEVYVSHCCGGVFVPGYGPDNIHEAEEGAVLDVPVPHPTGSNRRAYEKHEINHFDAEQYDAVRAGDCPMCDRRCPGLTLLGTTDPETDAPIEINLAKA
jgi:hypothetical protein